MRARRVAVVCLVILTACNTPAKHESVTPGEITKIPWQTIVQRARGTTVNFGMWAGDEERNRYFRSSVTESLLRDHNITLHLVPNGDTAEIVNKLLNEKGAGRTKNGSIDM